MSRTVLVYDPTAPVATGSLHERRSLDRLAGKVVGFIDNAKPNFNHLVDDLAQLLEERHGIAGVVKRAKRGASMPAPGSIIEEVATRCDLVIAGSGD